MKIRVRVGQGVRGVMDDGVPSTNTSASGICFFIALEVMFVMVFC